MENSNEVSKRKVSTYESPEIRKLDFDISGIENCSDMATGTSGDCGSVDNPNCGNAISYQCRSYTPCPTHVPCGFCDWIFF